MVSSPNVVRWSPALGRGERLLRIAAWTAVAVLLALQLASLPFYTGSSLGGRFHWRLEHARLTLKQAPIDFYHESFFVGLNTEGLKWTPEGRINSLTHWSVTIPLWMPLAAAVGVLVALNRRSVAATREADAPP